jgi:hypothetical protein
VSILSPVHIITLIPAFLRILTESIIVGLRGSWRPKIPIAVRFYSRQRRSSSFSKLLFCDFNELNSCIDISLKVVKIVR